MDRGRRRNGEGGTVLVRKAPAAAASPRLPRSRGISRTAWALAVLSGILQVLMYPVPDQSWLSWVALAPLLVALLRVRPAAADEPPQTASPAQAFWLAFVATFIWIFGSCTWVYHVMHVYGGLDAVTSFLLLLAFTIIWGALYGIFGILMALAAGRGRLGVRALLLAPFFWVSIEFLHLHAVWFPWDPLGTVQVGNIPVSQIATITGVYGLSFEIVLVNAAFAAAFLVDRARRRRVLLAAVAVAALLQAGTLIQPPPATSTTTARLVQGNIPITDNWTPQSLQDTLTAMAELSLAKPAATPAASPPPQLVIWPESPAPFFTGDPRLEQMLTMVAQRAHATVIAGAVTQFGYGDHARLYNSALLFDPAGQKIGRYDKIHLVPFGEYVPFANLFSFASKLTREVGDFVPGSERKVFQFDGYKGGVFICYESIFATEVRQFVLNGAQVLINISNDGWFGEQGAPQQHLNQARLRAIENHRWLLRSTNTGISVSVDPYGRVVARAPRNVRTAIDVPFGVMSGTTFYTRHGDWLAWACAIISAGAFAAALLRRQRPA